MDRYSTETVTSNRLAQSLRQMVDGADQLLRNAGRNSGDQFSAARDRFESQVRNARRELDQLQDTALYRARRAARATDRMVRDHPYATASVIAAGIGLAVGLMLWRNRD